ncbi:MAG: DUF1800 domain-containing protein [Planctomycetota bacterium]
MRSPVPPLTPWQPTSGHDWSRRKIGHLLRRSGFAPSATAIQEHGERQIHGALHRIFEPQPSAGDKTLDSIEKTVLGTKDSEAYAAWWLQKMLQTGDPLRERCALMWHGHFATSDAKVASGKLMARQCRLFRQHGLGDVRDLARKVTRDCAMLRFLDGNRNRKDHPNENFAREIFELFLLGIGNYTEQDIREAARAFTGYREENGRFVFRKDLHDTGPKTVFGKTGNFDGDDIIDLCFAREECATFLARRIRATFLAAEVATPRYGADVDRQLGQELRALDFNVGAFLRRLFESEIFFDPAHYRTLVKSPVEYAVGAARALEVRVPADQLYDSLAKMGQRLFAPPGVQGWAGGQAWLSSARVVARNQFASRIVEEVTAADEDPKARGVRLSQLLFDDFIPKEVRKVLANGKHSDAQLLHYCLMLPEFHVA